MSDWGNNKMDKAAQCELGFKHTSYKKVAVVCWSKQEDSRIGLAEVSLSKT